MQINELLTNGRGGAIRTPDPLRPRHVDTRIWASIESVSYKSHLLNPVDLISYNFRYSAPLPLADCDLLTGYVGDGQRVGELDSAPALSAGVLSSLKQEGSR